MNNSGSSRIASLAATIQHHTNVVDTYFAAQGKSAPTFNVDSPAKFDLPAEVETSRLQVLDASQELKDLMLEPGEFMKSFKYEHLGPLSVIAHFDVASHVPLTGTITYPDLASATSLDESRLRHLLRNAIAHRVFDEPQPGRVAHSAASRVLIDDPDMNGYIDFNFSMFLPATWKQTDAMTKWKEATEPNHTPFNLAHGTDEPMYQYISHDEKRVKQFARAMTSFTSGHGYSMQHVAKGYDWSRCGKLVDMGGSVGDAAFAVAKQYPDVEIVVQDLPHVLSQAAAEPGLNVQFMVHDFFQQQTVKDADVYLLRWIMHNYPDGYCIRILRGLVPALKAGATVLVMDFVMPPYGAVSNYEERLIRGFDVLMLKNFNAKEREAGEYQALFREVDTRFKWKGITRPEGSHLSFIEVVWEP